jgi:hypothetical protein
VFLVVDSKVFDASADSRALKTKNRRSGQAAREKWVFRVVLEVATAKGVTLDIQARAENDADAEGGCLSSDCGTNFLDEGSIPAAGERDGRRKASGWHAVVQSEMIAPASLYSKSVRPVRQQHSWDPSVSDFPSAPEVGTREQLDLLD